MKKLFGILAVTGAVVLPQAAQAGDSGVYLRLDPGVIIPNSTDYSVSGTVSLWGGTAAGTVSGDLSYDAGFSLNGAVGYQINPYVAVEGELGYAQFGLDSLSVGTGGTWTDSSGTNTYDLTANEDVALDGDADSFTGMVNVVVTPLGNSSKFVPAIGAGIGFASSEVALDSATIDGTRVAVNSEESETDLTATLMVGLGYQFNDNLTAGLKYRFGWVDNGTDIFDDFTANEVSVRLKYKF